MPIDEVMGLMLGVPGAQGGAPKTLSEAILALNPVAYWPLDDTSGLVATDASGNNRHAAYNANVQLAAQDFLTGKAPTLTSTGAIDVYAALVNNFDGQEFSILGWIKVPEASTWTNDVNNHAMYLYVNSPNRLQILATSARNRLGVYYDAAGVSIAKTWTNMTMTGWIYVAVTVSLAHDRERIYLNANDVIESTGIGEWTGALHPAISAIGAGSSSASPVTPWGGGVAHWAVFDYELTAAQIESVFMQVAPLEDILFCGDSKTDDDVWPWLTRQGIWDAAGAWYVEQPARMATGGWTVAALKAYLDANLATAVGSPTTILINLGANEMNTLPAEATWKANYTAVIDAFRAKWSGVNVYLAIPWRRGKATEVATLAGWIADIIALYPSGVLQGIDERDILPGADDGATMTTDGTHYSAAGQIAIAAAWVVVLTA